LFISKKEIPREKLPYWANIYSNFRLGSKTDVRFKTFKIEHSYLCFINVSQWIPISIRNTYWKPKLSKHQCLIDVIWSFYKRVQSYLRGYLINYSSFQQRTTDSRKIDTKMYQYFWMFFIIDTTAIPKKSILFTSGNSDSIS